MQEKKPASLNCPHCHQAAEYEVTWVVRTKKSQLGVSRDSRRAESAGKIVGEATLYRARHGWTKHVAELRLAVAPTMRRSGLGTSMARELVRLATRMGVEKMIIQVVENQVGARKMFRKLGFRQEAVLRGHVKDIHGMKRDLIVGANDISHIWDAMESLVADFSPSLE